MLCGVAFALRIAGLGDIEHNVDRAYPIWQALNTLQTGALPVTAQNTSVLFANPPLTGYLLIPAVIIGGTPYGAYIAVILSNTLAIPITYRIAKLMNVSEGIAWGAAWWVAINAWVIEYSRLTWVQGLLPFFCTLLCWGLVRLVTRPHPRILWVTLITLTLTTQTYLLAFILAAPVSLTLFFYRTVIFDDQPRMKRALIGGAAIFIIATGVYGAGLWSMRDQSLAQLGAFTGSGWRLSREAFDHAFRLVSGKDYPAARGTDAPIQDSALRQSLTELLHWGVIILIGIGVIRAVRSRGGGVLLIGFSLPILLMTGVSRPVHPFYLLVTLPIGGLLCMLGVVWLSQRIRLPIFRLLAGLLIIGVTTLNGVNAVRYTQATYAYPGAHEFSALPVREATEIATLLAPAPPATLYTPAEFWVVTSLSGQLLPVQPLPDTRRLLKIPPSGATYWLNNLPDQTLLPQPPLSTYTLRDGWRVLRYELPYAWALDQVDQRATIRTEQGLSLLGYRLTQTEGQITLWTLWQVDQLNNGRDSWLFHPFLHVFNEQGQRVGMADGENVSGAEFTQGLRYLHQIQLIHPADGVRVAFGQYDSLRTQNMIFILPTGDYTPVIEQPLPSKP
jgi:hypothetical protein